MGLRVLGARLRVWGGVWGAEFMAKDFRVPLATRQYQVQGLVGKLSMTFP